MTCVTAIQGYDAEGVASLGVIEVEFADTLIVVDGALYAVHLDVEGGTIEQQGDGMGRHVKGEGVILNRLGPLALITLQGCDIAEHQ